MDVQTGGDWDIDTAIINLQDNTSQVNIIAKQTVNTGNDDSYTNYPHSSAALNDGGYVVVWFNEAPAWDKNYKGRIFDNDGNAVGDEFQVNTYTPETGFANSANELGITALDDGGFFVCWSAYDDMHGGDGYDVYGQFFNAVGEKLGSEFQVNHLSVGDQFRPKAVEVDGGVLITYHSYNTDNATTDDNSYNDQSSAGIMGKFVPHPNYINNSEGSPEVIDVRLNNSFIDYENSDQYPRLEVVFDRAVSVEKDGVPITKVNGYDGADYISGWDFHVKHGVPGSSEGSMLDLTSGSQDIDSSFNMLESGMILSVEVKPVLGADWPNGHKLGFEFISSDFVVKDLNGNEVLLKDIIPERFFWNASTESPISIVQAPEGEMYDYYKALYEPLNNNTPLGSVTIDGDAIQGSTLLANTSTVDDYDGLGTLSYQWFANGESIVGATQDTFTLTQSEVGKEITVNVSYTDGYGAVESLISNPTSSVININDDPTGTVTIDGVAGEDETLTANTSSLADEDGLGTFSYQWMADNVAISGAVSDTFTLTQSEVGKEITVNVSYTDGYEEVESLISDPTDTVTNINDDPMGTVTIDGVFAQFETLTANTSSLTDEDGLGNFSYEWFANGESIDGATQATFTLTQSEVGKVISAEVSYTDNHSHYEVVTSGSSDPVENINEAPVIESSSFERLQIGSSLDTVIYDAEASDPDGDTLTYSLSGDDASYVTIDPDDGEVRLISAGDFKATYNFDVKVSDGILEDTQSVTLTYSLDPTSVYQVEYSGSVLDAAEANEVDPFSQLLSSETMPTDAELRGVTPVQDERMSRTSLVVIMRHSS